MSKNIKITVILFSIVIGILLVKGVFVSKTYYNVPDVPAGSLLLGDVNLDGKVSSADYILVKKYILSVTILGDNQKKNADVNSDGSINSADYITIRKAILYEIPIIQPTTVSIECLKGTYLKANATTCSQCDAGYFCSGGTFNKNSVVQGQNACPDGYTSDSMASANTDCYITVPKGYYKTSNTGVVTEACPAGTYGKASAYKSYYNSGDKCDTCPSNTYSEKGWGNCEPCANGQVSQAGSSHCTAPESSYVVTDHIPSGYEALSEKSYSSGTLKYKIIKNSSENEYFALVWVKDASKQLNNGSSGLTGGKKQATAHFKYEIDNGKRSKGMVGTNGGFAWGYYDNIPVLASNGKIKRNKEYQSWRWNNGQGQTLKYTTLAVKNDGDLIDKNVSRSDLDNYNVFTNDAAKKEKISEAGYKNFEKWMSDNGVRNAWGITTFKTENWVNSTSGADIRTGLCQIDKNNFVMAVNKYISIDALHYKMHTLFNCKVTINLDGGGSTGMYYKTGSMINASAIAEYKRPSENQHRDIVDIIYFVEQ